MLLRIIGKLNSIVLKKMKVDDQIDSNDLEKLPTQKRFNDQLIQMGIKKPFNFNLSKDGPEKHSIELKSFNGDENLIICKNINFNQIFLDYNKSDQITKLYRDFHDIFLKIKTNFYINDPLLLKSSIRNWSTLYTNCFEKIEVTPYIHLFTCHLDFLIVRDGDIDLFNIQGLEKLNDMSTREYFNATNKKSFIYQMLTKRLRDDYFNINKIPTIVEKRSFVPNLKNIKDMIRLDESKQIWFQYKIQNILLNNEEVLSFIKGQNVTFNVRIILLHIFL